MTEAVIHKRQARDPLAVRRKSLLWGKGLRQMDLATRWGISQSFVSQLISGENRSPKYEKLFAKIVGEPVEKLFPPRVQDAAE